MQKIVIFLADGFEEVEAVTPIDYLRRAEVDVTLAGVGTLNPTGSHGISIRADIAVSLLDWIPDGVILPGGLPGAKNLAESEDVSKICSKVMESGGLIASICAAPALALGSFGVLEGREYTCYPGFETISRSGSFSDSRVVIDENLITSRGPGTAAEFAIAIIRYLKGDEVAEKISESLLLNF